MRNIHYIASGARRYGHACLRIIEADASSVRGKDGEHEPYEGTLSYACLSYDCRKAARKEVVAERCDDFLVAVRICEVHIGEADSYLSIKAYRLAFLLLREFEFAEPVYRGHGVDSSSELSRQSGNRSLDLPYELQEGCHSSECNGTGSDAGNSPREGCNVACRESELDDAAREKVVVVARDGLSLKVIVIVFKRFYRLVCAFKRGNEGLVLDVFLEMSVYPAVCGAYLIGEMAHAVDVGAAQKEGSRHYKHHHKRKAPVHRTEEKQSQNKLQSSGYDCRHRAGKRIGNLGDIAVKPVEHVACVKRFPTKPAAFHDLREIPVAQRVTQGNICLRLEFADDDGKDYLQ